MNFPEKTLNTIMNLYYNAYCRLLIKNNKLMGITITQGVLQGGRSTGALFNVAMIPHLA